MPKRSKPKSGSNTPKIGKNTAGPAALTDRFHPARLILRRDKFLSGEQLAFLLRKSAGKPLPQWLNEYLIAFVRGKVKAPKGRKRHLSAATDFLLGDHVRWFRYEQARLAKIPKPQRMRSKVSGSQDPSILAAEYLVNHSKSLKKMNISGKRLLNLFSQYGWLG